MINRLRKAEQLPTANGETGGLIIDRASERIAASVSEKETDPRFVRAAAAEFKTSGNFSITDKDDGKTFYFKDAAASQVASLPAVSAKNKGMRVAGVVDALPAAGAGHAFSPAAADNIRGNGFTVADNKDAICSAASDRIGDYIELESDGVDGWVIVGVTGTWAREA